MHYTSSVVFAKIKAYNGCFTFSPGVFVGSFPRGSSLCVTSKPNGRWFELRICFSDEQAEAQFEFGWWELTKKDKTIPRKWNVALLYEMKMNSHIPTNMFMWTMESSLNSKRPNSCTCVWASCRSQRLSPIKSLAGNVTASQNLVVSLWY